jgi:hypothetical protein
MAAVARCLNASHERNHAPNGLAKPVNEKVPPSLAIQFLGCPVLSVQFETAVIRTRGPVLSTKSGQQQRRFAAHGALLESATADDGMAAGMRLKGSSRGRVSSSSLWA